MLITAQDANKIKHNVIETFFTMELQLFGINHKTSNVAERERFIINESNQILLDSHLKKVFHDDLESFFGISTCNRTEIYFEFENHIGNENKFIHSIVKELSEFRNFKDSLSPYLIKQTGSYNVSKHLFRLACGLESMIIGEFQIVEQLKEAYDFSYKHRMLGPILNRMVQKSLETGKFIRTNTCLLYTSPSPRDRQKSRMPSSA